MYLETIIDSTAREVPVTKRSLHRLKESLPYLLKDSVSMYFLKVWQSINAFLLLGMNSEKVFDYV